MDHPVEERSVSPSLCRGYVYQRYDGATEWGVHRRGQLSRSWRSVILEGEEPPKFNENRRAEGRAREEAAIASTHCELDLENSARGVGGQAYAGYPSHAPSGGLCASVACWNERVALREGLQARSLAPRAAASGQGESDPLTQQSMKEACQLLSLGEVGRR